MGRIEVFRTETYTEIETEENAVDAAIDLFSGLIIVLSALPEPYQRMTVLKAGYKLVKKKLKERARNERRNQS